MYKKDFMILDPQTKIYILLLYNQIVIKIFWNDSNLFTHNYNLNFVIWF